MKVKDFKNYINQILSEPEDSFFKILVEYRKSVHVDRIKSIRANEIKIIVNYYDERLKDEDNSKVLSIDVLVNLMDVDFEAPSIEKYKYDICIIFISSLLTYFDDVITIEVFDMKNAPFYLSNKPRFETESESNIDFYCGIGDSEIIEVESLDEELNLQTYFKSINAIICSVG